MSSRLSSPSEHMVLWHAGFVVIAASWLLGGRGLHGEWIVAACAAPALWFLFAEGRARLASADRAAFRSWLLTLAPLAALTVLTLVSALNPSHREAFLVDGMVLRPVPYVSWLPSSARPLESLRTLACFGSLACTGFCLLFCVHSRRGLRTLMVALTANGAALAILGTVQRHLDATGPYFGQVAAVNPWWFSTFLYYGHWAAFATLSLAAALGLVFHHLQQGTAGRWASGPGPLLTLATFLIAATGPFSGSRAATLLVAALIIPALFFAGRRLLRRPAEGGSYRGVWVLLAITILGAGLVTMQSGDVLLERVVARTSRQLEAHRADKSSYGRAEVRTDTWTMAMARPVFGWGLGSFGGIFIHYSTILPDSNGQVTTYEEAVCDWLQSLAEIGVVGSALLLLCVVAPLVDILRKVRLEPLSCWLLGGCGLVAAYAWLEFPLACPALVATWWILFFTALRHAQLAPTRRSKNTVLESCSPFSS